MKLEPLLYELRPLILIAIALAGLHQIGWNTGTICAAILITIAVMILNWRLRGRSGKPPSSSQSNTKKKI